MRQALDLGITHFDAAQFFSNRRVNELLRESFAGVRENIVIATKTGARPRRSVWPGS